MTAAAHTGALRLTHTMRSQSLLGSASHLSFSHLLVAAAQIMTMMYPASLPARTEAKGTGPKDMDTEKGARFTVPTR